MKFILSHQNVILICLFVFSSSVCIASCDVAFDAAVTNGILNEAELSQFLECKSEPMGPKRKPVIHSLCVFSGIAKDSKADEYGAELISIILGGDTEAESLFPEVVGTWYSHKIYSKEISTEPSESIAVATNNLGVKITKTSARNSTAGKAQVDRIQISKLEKKLIFERLHRIGNSPQLKLDREYSLDCSKASLKTAGEEAGEGSAGGKVPGTKIFDARAKKARLPYKKPNSGITSGEK